MESIENNQKKRKKSKRGRGRNLSQSNSNGSYALGGGAGGPGVSGSFQGMKNSPSMTPPVMHSQSQGRQNYSFRGNNGYQNAEVGRLWYPDTNYQSVSHVYPTEYSGPARKTVFTDHLRGPDFADPARTGFMDHSTETIFTDSLRRSGFTNNAREIGFNERGRGFGLSGAPRGGGLPNFERGKGGGSSNFVRTHQGRGGGSTNFVRTHQGRGGGSTNFVRNQGRGGGSTNFVRTRQGRRGGSTNFVRTHQGRGGSVSDRKRTTGNGPTKRKRTNLKKGTDGSTDPATKNSLSNRTKQDGIMKKDVETSGEKVNACSESVTEGSNSSSAQKSNNSGRNKELTGPQSKVTCFMGVRGSYDIYSQPKNESESVSEAFSFNSLFKRWNALDSDKPSCEPTNTETENGNKTTEEKEVLEGQKSKDEATSDIGNVNQVKGKTKSKVKNKKKPKVEGMITDPAELPLSKEESAVGATNKVIRTKRAIRVALRKELKEQMKRDNVGPLTVIKRALETTLVQVQTLKSMRKTILNKMDKSDLKNRNKANMMVCL